MKLLRAIAVTVLLCGASAPARADDSFEAKHQRAVVANPSGLHLRISLDNGQARFRIGDTIELQYQLSADTPGKYVAGLRVYDRSRRSTLETFVVDRPRDASDPLGGFWDLYTAIACLNYSSGEDPKKKLDPASPEQDSFEITHYLRFKRPGKYRLYAVTRSVVAADANPRNRSGPPLASENTVSIEVLPQDAEEATRELDAILLRADDQLRPQFMPADAFRLFEIGTPEASRAAARLYIPQNTYAYGDSIALATVIADPSRSKAIALLKSRLRDPKISVDEDQLMDLALLQLLQRNHNLTAHFILQSARATGDRWRNIFIGYLLTDIRAAMATLDQRPAATRASSVRALYHVGGYRACSLPLPLADEEKRQLSAMHLATLPDLPDRELTYELLNFGWAKDLPKDQVMKVLLKIYQDPSARGADMTRETALKDIQQLDPDEARTLFRHRIVEAKTPLDWNRIRHLNLPPGADLDADLINALEGRWTEDVTRVAPLIGLYATPSILPRVKKVYEVDGTDWPCSIEAGLLTYFLRVDPDYGAAKLGPALDNYYAKGGSDCHEGTLLVTMALLRNAPELKPFVSAALNDPRPLVAAGGARVTEFGDVAQIPFEPLVARLRQLHDDWQDFDARKDDPEYMQRWNSGYHELERIIAIGLVNANDTPPHAAAWKAAYGLCISDQCRTMLRQRMDRSRY